jgi:hypothetical protein
MCCDRRGRWTRDATDDHIIKGMALTGALEFHTLDPMLRLLLIAFACYRCTSRPRAIHAARGFAHPISCSMPARVFKVQEFRRWAKREGLTDASLREAAQEIEDGLIDAGLGGVLIKKRVAAAGRGKRGGYRTIAA